MAMLENYSPSEMLKLQGEDEVTEITTVLVVKKCDQDTFISAFDSNAKGECHNHRFINPDEARAIFEKPAQLGLIDPRLLFQNNHYRVWHYSPSDDQALYYHYAEKASLEPVKWCDLIVVAGQGKMYLAAIERHSERPVLDTQLFCAPLPNVYGDGRVCLGGVSFQDATDIDLIMADYFDSTKTHLIANNIFSSRISSDASYFQWLQEKKEHLMEMSELNTFKTLGEFISGITAC